MKRTVLIFVVAAVLGLVALAVGLVPLPGKPVQPVTAHPVPPPPQSAGGLLQVMASLSDPYIVAGSTHEVFLRADIDAAAVGSSERAPVNLAVVLDRSGSMAGEKIAQCRRAARQLVEQLDARDRFALVTFGSDVTTLVPSTLATPPAKQRMLAAIEGIAELGGTNLSGALEAGLAEVVPYRHQYNASRIVLLSDGQANEGISDAAGLSALARRMAAQGLTLSAIGVGLDFNENVMASLAEYGGGAYHFLSNVERLSEIFATELKQAVTTVAVGATVTLTPRPGVTVAEVYGYLTEVSDTATTVRLPDFASGQHRRVVARLLVPASAPGHVEVVRVGLAYLDATRNRAPGAAEVVVGAAVTGDPTLALSARSKDVAAEAARAQALTAMRRAGSLAQEGRRDEAGTELRAAREAIQKAEGDIGKSPDLDEALLETNAFEGALAAPAGSVSLNAGAKRIHAYSNSRR